MTKTYEGPGDTVTLIAPGGGVTSGLGLVVGGAFAVAQAAAAAAAEFPAMLTGRHRLPKVAATAWVAGVKLYWDPTPGELTTTGAAGSFLIGTAAAPAASADATAAVALDGIAVTAV